MNELYDINTKLKEVFHLPYMYCNQEGCNETVKLPAQYCAKHKRLKVPDPLPEPESVKPLRDTTHLDLLDKANKSMNTKKNTK